MNKTLSFLQPLELKAVPESPVIDLAELFPPGEHGIYAYFGRIGQGKTYAMTSDIIEALMSGQVVYSNYPLDWRGFDQRRSLTQLLAGMLGIKRQFYEFLQSNLHFIEVDEHFHDKLAGLTDCIVALDEGYVAFDSYEMAKMSMKKRKNVLHTRHFDRSIWYTTQRPNAVHVTMRAQTNVFYKIQKVWDRFGLLIFRRQELDLGSDDSVNDQEIFSTKYYRGKKAVFEAYNTKYLRYGAKPSQPVGVIIHRLSPRIASRMMLQTINDKFPNRLKAVWEFGNLWIHGKLSTELSTYSQFKEHLRGVLPSMHPRRNESPTVEAETLETDVLSKRIQTYREDALPF